LDARILDNVDRLQEYIGRRRLGPAKPQGKKYSGHPQPATQGFATTDDFGGFGKSSNAHRMACFVHRARSRLAEKQSHVLPELKRWVLNELARRDAGRYRRLIRVSHHGQRGQDARKHGNNQRFQFPEALIQPLGCNPDIASRDSRHTVLHDLTTAMLPPQKTQ
jgi:hypothetical protein